MLRPLLSTWREEIDAYIAAHALRFREDATNDAMLATRNRIRHRILPSIEKELGRDVRKSIWRAAAIAAEEYALLEELTPNVLSASGSVPVARLRDLPPALQRRALRHWLRDRSVPEISFDLLEKTRALLNPSSGLAKINLPGDRHARRRAGQLFIE